MVVGMNLPTSISTEGGGVGGGRISSSNGMMEDLKLSHATPPTMGNGSSAPISNDEASTSHDLEDQEGQKVVDTDPTGRFEKYNELIGAGAYKEVYKGFDQEEGVEVAWNQLKVANLSKRDLNKVISEIQILQSLENDNIINCAHYWAGKTKDGGHDEIVFITELMTSGTLKSYIKKAKGQIKTKVLKNWCRQILNGLMYLHTRDPPIIHRDVKCENIFINGNHGEVKIGDLGLATFRFRDHASSVLGTPEFMAPELYDEKYDEKVDIYAFGMCVLEMVTKEYPYNECTNAAQIYKKVTAGIMPEALKKVTDPEIREFIELCLVREPEKRLSAKDLLEHRFLETEDSCDEKEAEDLTSGHANLKSMTSPPISSGTVSNEFLNSYSTMSLPLSQTLNELSLDHMKEEPQTHIEVLEATPDQILLRLLCTFTDNRGNQDIRFPFNVGKDTPMSITDEMVKENLLLASLRETVADQLNCVITEVMDRNHSSRKSRDDESQTYEHDVSESFDERTQVQKKALPKEIMKVLSNSSLPTGIEDHDSSALPIMTTVFLPTTSPLSIREASIREQISTPTKDPSDEHHLASSLGDSIRVLKLNPDSPVILSSLVSSTNAGMSPSTRPGGSQGSISSESGMKDAPTIQEVVVPKLLDRSLTTESRVEMPSSMNSPATLNLTEESRSKPDLLRASSNSEINDRGGDIPTPSRDHGAEGFKSTASSSSSVASSTMTTSAIPMTSEGARCLLVERPASASPSPSPESCTISAGSISAEENLDRHIKRSKSTQGFRRVSPLSQDNLETRDKESDSSDPILCARVTGPNYGVDAATTTGGSSGGVSIGTVTAATTTSSLKVTDYSESDLEMEDFHEDEEYRYLLIRQKLELENLRRRHQLERDALKKSRLARAKLRALKQTEKPLVADTSYVNGAFRAFPEERDCSLVSQELKESLMAQHLMLEVEKFGQTQKPKSCGLSGSQAPLSKGGATTSHSMKSTQGYHSAGSTPIGGNSYRSSVTTNSSSSANSNSAIHYSCSHPPSHVVPSQTGRPSRESTMNTTSGTSSSGNTSGSRQPCLSSLLPRPMSYEILREEVSIDLDEFDPIKRDEKKKEMTQKMLAEFESKAILGLDVSLSSSGSGNAKLLVPPTLEDLSKKSKLSLEFPSVITTLPHTTISSDHLNEPGVSEVSMRSTSGSSSSHAPSVNGNTTTSTLTSPTISEPSLYTTTMLPELHVNGHDSRRAFSATFPNHSTISQHHQAVTSTTPSTMVTNTSTSQNTSDAMSISPAKLLAAQGTTTGAPPISCSNQVRMPTDVLTGSPDSSYPLRQTEITGVPIPSNGTAAIHSSTMMSSFGGPIVHSNSMMTTPNSAINIMSSHASHPSLIPSHDPDDHLLS